jgi:hypothetical protein
MRSNEFALCLVGSVMFIRDRLDPGQLVVVHAAEEPLGNVPAELVDELVHHRLLGAPPRQACVEGRALRLELLRLTAEDRALVDEPSGSALD